MTSAPAGGEPGATRFVARRGTHLAFDDPEAGSGEPVLLLMGTGASRFWWPPGFVRALQDAGFRPAGFDLPGTGESAPAPGRETAEDLADDAVAVLDALGWPRAHLFGLSLGGLVAQRVALRHPGRVLTLTCFAVGPSDASTRRVIRYVRPLTQLRMLARWAGARARRDDVALRLGIARAAGSPAHPFDERVARRAIAREDALGVVSFRDLRAQHRRLTAPWHGPGLATLSVPTLVMAGTADPVVHPRAARDLARLVPGARLRLLPDVGHDLPPTAWPVVVGELRALADSVRDDPDHG